MRAAWPLAVWRAIHDDATDSYLLVVRREFLRCLAPGQRDVANYWTRSVPNAWTCEHCRSEQTHETYCEACERARFASWDVQVSEHVLEHFADAEADGTVLSPLDMQKLMNARPCYARMNYGNGFALTFIAQRMRLLTTDTRALARRIFDMHAARMALNVVHNGDTKDHISVLKGRQVLGDVVEHKGDIVTRHVVELHEGPPPKREP